MEATIKAWLLQVVAMLITALVIPRLRITSVLGAFGIVAALAFVNATLWDAALFFSVPQSASLEALVLLIANGVIFWVLTKLMPGIEVRGVLAALVAPLVFTLVGLLVTRYAAEIDLAALASGTLDAIVSLRDWLSGGGTPGGGS